MPYSPPPMAVWSSVFTVSLSNAMGRCFVWSNSATRARPTLDRPVTHPLNVTNFKRSTGLHDLAEAAWRTAVPGSGRPQPARPCPGGPGRLRRRGVPDVFAQAKPEDVHAAWDKTRDELATWFSELGPLMMRRRPRSGRSPPSPGRTGARSSTNPLKHINKESSAAAESWGSSDNAAVIRLVGADLLDMHDMHDMHDKVDRTGIALRLRRPHGQRSRGQRYRWQCRNRERRVGTEDDLKAHHPAGALPAGAPGGTPAVLSPAQRPG